MGKEKLIIQDGTVIDALPNVMFRVKLDINDQILLCHTCGNMKKNFIKILPGDRVRLEMSMYDMTKGRITQRLGDVKPMDSNDRSINGKKRK